MERELTPEELEFEQAFEEAADSDDSAASKAGNEPGATEAGATGEALETKTEAPAADAASPAGQAGSDDAGTKNGEEQAGDNKDAVGQAASAASPAQSADQAGQAVEEGAGSEEKQDPQALLEQERHARKSAEGRVRKLQEEIEALKGKSAPAPKPAPTQPQKADLQAEDYDDEQIRDILEFKRMNPAYARFAEEPTPEGARFRKKIIEFGSDVATEFADLVMGQRKTMALARDLATKKHFEAIHAAHPDFAELAKVGSDLDTWIEEQPAYVRPALQRVVESGSTAEVIELLSDYKQARGKVSAPPTAKDPAAPAAPIPPAAPAQGPDKKKEQKVAAAAAVPSRGRPQLPKAVADPEDFDAAWEEATKA